VKNKNYWNSPKPYLDEVIFQMVPDQQSMVTALEAGALDVADNASIPDMTRLTKDGRFKAFIVPFGTTLFGFNTTREPTNNKALRQAFQYALDRKRICEVVYEGTAKPKCIPWIEGSEAYDESKINVYTYDVDKAKSLYDATGLGPMTMSVNVSSAAPDLNFISQIFQGDLAKIGVTLQIRLLDQGRSWTSRSSCPSAPYLAELSRAPT
jgi:ABC-type transport system substrate-binding protein